MSDANEPLVRASDLEREAVIARLNAAVGEGRLNIEEFSERVSAVYASRTRQELVPLTADLPVQAGPPHPAPAQSPARPPVLAQPVYGQPVVAGSRPPDHVIPFGTVKRSGAWRLERDTHIEVVFGTVKLDLRQAVMAASEVAVNVSTVFGTIKVTVPSGLRVEIEGTSVFGGRLIEENQGTLDPGAPVLRMRLDTVFGTVKVYRV